jgi:single-strand DNA-binding protein
LNKILLIGNLGRDPEFSYTPNGTPNAKFSIAVNKRVKGSDGNYQNETEWFNCVAWQKTAEICNEYLKKGSKVYVEGRLSQRKYQDKNGNEKLVVEVIINDMEMLSKKEENTQKFSMDEEELVDHPF